ncbi:MAG: acyl-CoA synthetase, partial [Acidimicrobiia bacterium]
MDDRQPRLPEDYLSIPERVNITGTIVARPVAEGRGDRPALHIENRTVTYAELESLTNRFGHALAAAGVGRGDHFVVRSPNSVEYVVAVLGGMKIGAVPIPASSLYRAWELEHILTNSGASLVFTTEELLPAFDEVAPRCPALAETVLLEGTRPGLRSFEEFLAGHPDTSALADTAADDPAYAIYTSGTTGRPKGVVRDNGGHAVALRWSMPNVYDTHPGEVFWAASDVGWVVGHSYIVYAPLLTGCTTILYEGKPVGTPDPGAFWRVIAQHGVKTLFTAPTAFRAIKKEYPDGSHLSSYDLSRFVYLFLAGERLDPDTYHWAKDLLNVPVIDHWW